MTRLAGDPADSADASADGTSGTLTLAFDDRQRSRLSARLDHGEEVGLRLPRGTVLRGGDLIRAEDGTTVRVAAAPERVSTIRSGDATLLARACYHLGSRRVALQIADGWVRYRHDRVLDRMVGQLGLAVQLEVAPFEPEAGAYGGGHPHIGSPDHALGNPRDHHHRHGHHHGEP